MKARINGLTARQFYALIWKDFVVHKRHYIWTLLEITIPVLVCAMAILSNTHQGKPKLENERIFDPDDYERIYGDLNPARHKLLVAPNSSFTRALIDQIDDGAVSIELCNSESELVDLIKKEIPVSLDQVKRLLPDDTTNVTIGGVVIKSDDEIVKQERRLNQNKNGGLNSTMAPKPTSNSMVTTTTTTTTPTTLNKNSYYFEVISKLDGQKMKIPVNFDMTIRAKDFRLGPDAFPKKYSLGPFLHSDHYTATFFMASQIMLSRAYINLLANYLNSTSNSSSITSNLFNNNNNSKPLADIVIPTNDDLIGQRMPYPKYVAHKRLKETTLGTFVAGSQKQKPFVLTMDYCITVGFLVTAIFLAKRIVDEKKSKVRDMLRLVGISDWTYYGSHMCNTMIIMIIQCIMITLLFTGHQDAPAQNINSSLLFTILILYCLSSIMFVLTLSTIFSSSTKAIIFTSLLWLGLPEIIDRIFKMNSGVIESNGFLAVDEHIHLMFCLLPNFGLRLMNRLLTECDIYGEFYDKKQLYGEYRAIWQNTFNVLPLYKSITVGHIMLALFLSIPMHATLIYLINLGAASQGGLANLGETGSDTKKRSTGIIFKLIKWSINLIIVLIVAPFKLVYNIISAIISSDKQQGGVIIPVSNVQIDLDPRLGSNNWSSANLNQSTPNVIFLEGKKPTGYLNSAFISQTSINNSEVELKNYPVNEGRQQQILSCSSLESVMPASDQKAFDNSNGSCPSLIKGIEDCDAQLNDPKYFETAPKMLNTGVSIRNLCKTYFTSSSKLRRIDAVRNVSLDMFYSQILGKFSITSLEYKFLLYKQFYKCKTWLLFRLVIKIRNNLRVVESWIVCERERNDHSALHMSMVVGY